MTDHPTLPFEAAERWLPVVDWEGLYEVSDLGRIRSLPRKDGRNHIHGGRMLKGHPAKKRGGYVLVALTRGGVGKTQSVHILVAAAFLGPRPEGLDVLHSDGNPANNVLTNLRYGTTSENVYDSVRHGTHPWARMTECKHGHAFDEQNTRIDAKGHRICKACRRRYSVEQSARRKQRRQQARRDALAA